MLLEYTISVTVSHVTEILPGILNEMRLGSIF